MVAAGCYAGLQFFVRNIFIYHTFNTDISAFFSKKIEENRNVCKSVFFKLKNIF